MWIILDKKKRLNFQGKVAGLTRLELATFRVTGGRSNQSELQPLESSIVAMSKLR